MDSSGLWLFRKPELFAVCEDSGSLALCNETANILAPYQLSKRISPLLHPFCSMVCLLLSVHLTLSFFPLLFQLSYSHLLIFSSFCLSLSLTLLPSHSFPAHFYLFSSITSSAMFSFNHPLKKYIHLRATGLLLDHIVCCYSCYHGNSYALGVARACDVNGPLQEMQAHRGAKMHIVGSCLCREWWQVIVNAMGAQW